MPQTSFYIFILVFDAAIRIRLMRILRFVRTVFVSYWYNNNTYFAFVIIGHFSCLKYK